MHAGPTSWPRRMRRWSFGDGVSVLTVYLVLLVGIPSRLVVQGVGGIGAPFSLLALACALWWVWEMSRRSVLLGVPGNPARTAATVFLVAVFLSYWVEMRRPVSPSERSVSDLGVIGVIGWLGVLFLTHDGIPTLERFKTFARRVVAAGGALSTLALAQFFTGRSLTDLIRIPGLVTNGALVSLASREGFNRPAGTAIHAIEFSVVVTMILPLAIAVARSDDVRPWWRRWYPTAAIAASVPIALSRSAIVGAVVGLLVLVPTLPARARRSMLIGGAVLLGAVFLVIPGMIGTLTGLFTGIKSDDSAGSRVDSYGMVWSYFVRSPLFGRGPFTFQPAYRILDNQYLGLLIDVGLFGLVAFVLLLVAGMVSAGRVRRSTLDPQLRELSQGLIAAIAVGATGFALFDGLGFPMAASFLFLFVGMAGSLWRLVRLDGPGRPAAPEPHESGARSGPAHRLT